jgi:hypothetical protein
MSVLSRDAYVPPEVQLGHDEIPRGDSDKGQVLVPLLESMLHSVNNAPKSESRSNATPIAGTGCRLSEHRRRVVEAGSVSWMPVDGAFVRVWRRHVWRMLSDLSLEAQTPEDPRAKPARWLLQLCFPGFRLVGVVEPYRSWGTGLPAPRHAVSVSQNTRLTPARYCPRPPGRCVTRFVGASASWPVIGSQHECEERDEYCHHDHPNNRKAVGTCSVPSAVPH